MGVVDGDHSSEGCRNDLEMLANLEAKIIIVDDTLWLPYLDTVCREFASEKHYDYINLELYTGLGILVRRELWM